MFKKRAEKKFKQKIESILHLGYKVLAYRKDVLENAIAIRIQAELNALKDGLAQWIHAKDPGDFSKKKRALIERYERLDRLLKEQGGSIYPLTFWNENLEVLLVAALLAIGVRTFFIQPFRIPTSSMFPSFSGMQTRLHNPSETKPGVFQKAFRWLTEGAEGYTVTAPSSGNVKLPLFKPSDAVKNGSHVRFSVVYGRELLGLWLPFLLPKPYRVYTLKIGENSVELRVPFEFIGMEDLFTKTFFPQFSNFQDVLKNMQHSLGYVPGEGLYLHTGHYLKKGENLLRFDLLSGDMLFVDRFTYHFRRPRVGEAVVFKTLNIPKLNEDKYYIKRLVGQAGDLLQIKESKLFSNGFPIKGSLAFEGNNQKLGLYPGYLAKGNLETGRSVKVPDRMFYVLGDNSPYSYDSRYWDFVPEKEVIGKALLVVHPWSWRWGLAEKEKSNAKSRR